MLEGFRTLKISQIGACLADPIKNTADHNIGGTPCIWPIDCWEKKFPKWPNFDPPKMPIFGAKKVASAAPKRH